MLDPPASSDESVRQVVADAEAELRSMARAIFREEGGDHTLQPTALLGELWLRLARGGSTVFKSKVEFYAWAAKAMRHVLIDYARARSAKKRTPTPDAVPSISVTFGDGLDLLDLHEAMNRLARWHPRAAQVVEMRFFGSMTIASIAERLSSSERTVRGDWALARAWLHREITSGARRAS